MNKAEAINIFIAGCGEDTLDYRELFLSQNDGQTDRFMFAYVGILKTVALRVRYDVYIPNAELYYEITEAEFTELVNLFFKGTNYTYR